MIIRSAFFAIGAFILLWGITFLLADKIVIQTDVPAVNEFPVWQAISTPISENTHELSPPEWAPFGLLSLGAVTMLYSIALPKKQG